ncbi:TPA: hypothetical protein NKQ81_004631 [Vibrio parahaemolyticus]|uniref:hypothetical protein n=1 Tax=Vibrio parahaemolyticus TaxID=670 RepID=UPI001869C075|nr:hypothetical protein [Vibrio parahaemolyticus]MBE4440592.1 hypothetical protein [Vibrio parahaemolyticus]MCR9893286.1 hypothetical protein [Vibrio parahaemolyticus]HCH1474585.1 hypothetical protein [Vibrio parahaemolyticus]
MFYMNGKLTSGVSLTRNSHLDHRRSALTVRVTLDYSLLRSNSKIIPVHSNNKYGEIVHESSVRASITKSMIKQEHIKLLLDPSIGGLQIKQKLFSTSQSSAFLQRVDTETVKVLKMNKFVPSNTPESKLSSNGRQWCEEFHLGEINLSRIDKNKKLTVPNYILAIEVDSQSFSTVPNIDNWCRTNGVTFGCLK